MTVLTNLLEFLLPTRMGSITLEEKDEEEALFIRKKGPQRSRGEAKEAKEWTRGDRLCPKKSSYLGGAQQESDDEDDQELVRMRREEKASASTVARMGILLGTVRVQEGTQKEMWLL